MKHSLTTRLATLAALSAVALPTAGTAGADDGFVPFVTDFPKAEAPAEPYRPFATDFGIGPRAGGGGFVVNARGHSDDASGRAWGDVALGGALGIGLAGLVAAAALGGARLRGDRRRAGLEPQAAPRG
jgi:hypothetical protein